MSNLAGKAVQLQQAINQLKNQLMGGVSTGVGTINVGGSFTGFSYDEELAAPQISHPTKGLGKYVSPTRLVWDSLHNKVLDKMWVKYLHEGKEAVLNAQKYSNPNYYTTSLSNAVHPTPGGITGAYSQSQLNTASTASYQAMQQQINQAAEQQRAEADSKLQQNMGALRKLFFNGGGGGGTNVS